MMKLATKLLDDYDFKQDIEDRLFLSKLNLFEVEVLREILDNSLHFSSSKLADILAVPLTDLEPVLEMFASKGILVFKGDKIDVDKEKRKLLDLQIGIFEDDFQAGIGYIFSLLKHKVPLHYLPLWYQISRAADFIFEALVDKFLLYPETYLRYLEELVFDHPFLEEIRKAVLKREGIPSLAGLQKEYGLSEEELEELILQLEYAFICCKVLIPEGNGWRPELRPLYEWNALIAKVEELRPEPIAGPVEMFNDRPFAFVEDMKEVLEAATQAPIPLKKNGAFDLSGPMPGLFDLSNGIEEYFQEIMQKSLAIGLAVVKKGGFHAAPFSATWNSLPPNERAVFLHRHPANVSDDRVWQAERCLKCLKVQGWIFFEDFLRFCVHPLADVPGVRLEKIGKKWKYVFPTYSEEGIQLLRDVVFKRLFQVGMADIGSYQGRECFRLTDFGRSILL